MTTTVVNSMALLVLITGILALSQVRISTGNTESESRVIGRWWSAFSTSYPKYAVTTEIIMKMEQLFPNLIRVYSIGKSVGGLELWVLHLADNVRRTRPLLRPMVKFVANIHGDEVLGRSLGLMLATKLLQGYLDRNRRMIKILRYTDLHILFSINPDGFEVAAEGVCDPNPHVFGRRNRNNVDLNRSFPDQFETQTPKPEPETIHVMNWIKENPFVLSISMHAGAVVACYPYDSMSEKVAKTLKYYSNYGVESPSPDNAVFVYLAKLYSNAHKFMHTGQGDPKYCTEVQQFAGGISNGADWFNVVGGMQDFNYVNSNCFEITIELSCCKYPPASELLQEWNNNQEAIYQYIEAVHMGIKGVITGARSGAKIVVDGIDHPVQINQRGEYWRLLLPGTYRVSVLAPGFTKHTFPTNVQVVDTKSPIVLNYTFERPRNSFNNNNNNLPLY